LFDKKIIIMRNNLKYLFLVIICLQCFSYAKAADEERIFQTKPYLESPYGNGITVMWITNVPCYSWVEYGTEKSHLQKLFLIHNGVIAANNTIQKFRLSDLQAGKTYYYRVCSREIKDYHAYNKTYGETAVSELYSFRLPAKNEKTFTAVIFNDIHRNMEVFQKLCSLVKDVKYDFSVMNGDCLNDVHEISEGEKYISSYFSALKASTIPVVYIRGNHELRDIFALHIYDYIDFLNGKTYGTFNWGDTHFVVMDCGEDKPDSTKVYGGLNDFSQMRSDETAFLRNELKSKAFQSAAKRVLLCHVPLYGYSDAYHPCADAWQPLLHNATFNVGIFAHEHVYAYLPKKIGKQNFPVVIGGGPSLNLNDGSAATVMVLQKTAAKMSIKVIRVDGKVLLNMDL
jgi:Icc-related predicted phosphoesterase